MSVHTLLAIRLKSPEWELTKEEAKRLDVAIKNVARHYPLAVTQKQLDIAFAVYAVVDVYGTRIVKTVGKKKSAPGESQAKANTSAEPSGVLNFAFPQPKAR